MLWIQRELVLPEFSRGIHPITSHVTAAIPELRQVTAGLLHVFIHHTSAALTINESADSDVPRDLAAVTATLWPEHFPYRHTIEGRDDMPAHIAASMFGCDLTIPVGDGSLKLGVWQGIFLVEARIHGGRRHIILTLSGTEA